MQPYPYSIHTSNAMAFGTKVLWHTVIFTNQRPTTLSKLVSGGIHSRPPGSVRATAMLVFILCLVLLGASFIAFLLWTRFYDPINRASSLAQTTGTTRSLNGRSFG